ncbi:uncharacterized protein [Lepeophtheirus salmonis]|uniref:uncharacterized protein n=1 Tax=Lepeophtheirus salmonis TaxID=72036 RepID=UPI001AE9F120|nr:uncharacterized protein LOC121129921 [Lepeophtheirus salmonis]
MGKLILTHFFLTYIFMEVSSENYKNQTLFPSEVQVRKNVVRMNFAILGEWSTYTSSLKLVVNLKSEALNQFYRLRVDSAVSMSNGMTTEVQKKKKIILSFRHRRISVRVKYPKWMVDGIHIVWKLKIRSLDGRMALGKILDLHKNAPRLKLISSKLRKNDKTCHLEDWSINLKQLGDSISKRFLFPPSLNINRCVGSCHSDALLGEIISTFPVYYTIKNIFMMNKFGVSPKACCVPLQFKSLTVLELHNGQITKRRFKTATAISCGCRSCE